MEIKFTLIVISSWLIEKIIVFFYSSLTGTKKEVDKHVRTTLVKMRTDNEVCENEKFFFSNFYFVQYERLLRPNCSVCNVKKIELCMDCHFIEWICSKLIFLFRESSLKNNTHRNIAIAQHTVLLDVNIDVVLYTSWERERWMTGFVAFLAGFFKLQVLFVMLKFFGNL